MGKKDGRAGRQVYSRRQSNQFIEKDNYYIMIVSNQEVIIDKDDYDKIKEYKWRLNKYGYAVSDRCYKEMDNLFLHQFIFGKKENYLIDHINRNQLDNRKSNMRYATKQTNSMNSKVVGVSYRSDTNKWTALIVIDGKRKCLGCFVDKQDALQARHNAERLYFTPKIMEVSVNG